VPSITSAFDKGVVAVESDIWPSKDGTLWLLHDPTLERTTNGRGVIRNSSDAQIAALDAGSWFGFAYAGTRVPKLTDALIAVKDRGVIYLDPKSTGLARKILMALNTTGFQQAHTWIWAQGLEAEIRELHSVLPDAKIIWSGAPFNGKTFTDPSYFTELRSAGVYGLDVAWDSVYQGNVPLRDTPDFVSAARANGMWISTYTLDTRNTMAEAIYRGVNGFTTNYPERVAPLLATSNGTSTLNFNGKATWAIPRSFGSWNAEATSGSAITGDGTPWIELTWSVKEPQASSRWVLYRDREWDGVARLNNFTNAGGFDVLFTPAKGFGVRVDSFVFDDYAGNDVVGSAFTWTLYRDGETGPVVAGGTHVLTDGQNLLVSTGMGNVYKGSLLLRLQAATNPHGPNAGLDASITDLTYTMSELRGGDDES
jgi:glycerophosphoryl diester phosphodiesterase